MYAKIKIKTITAEFKRGGAMKSEKNAVLWAAVLNCICAAVWDLNLALVLFYGWRSDSYLGLSIVTALIWNIIAIRFVVKYKKDKKKYENSDN